MRMQIKDEPFRMQVVQQILDDRDSLLMQRLAVRQNIFKLLAQDRELEQKLMDRRAAGRVFGQSVAVPTDPSDYESPEALLAAMEKLWNGKGWEPGKSKA